jgi:hypothetical protein
MLTCTEALRAASNPDLLKEIERLSNVNQLDVEVTTAVNKAKAGFKNPQTGLDYFIVGVVGIMTWFGIRYQTQAATFFPTGQNNIDARMLTYRAMTVPPGSDIPEQNGSNVG